MFLVFVSSPRRTNYTHLASTNLDAKLRTARSLAKTIKLTERHLYVIPGTEHAKAKKWARGFLLGYLWLAHDAFANKKCRFKLRPKCLNCSHTLFPNLFVQFPEGKGTNLISSKDIQIASLQYCSSRPVRFLCHIPGVCVL